MQLSDQYGWGWCSWNSQALWTKKKGKNWCVTVQIELFLKNWSRRAWNKGLEPSSPVLHVLYGLSCVLQRPFTRLVLAQFMYFGIERNWLPQFLLFIFWTVTFKQNEKEKKYWNNETVTMVSLKCSSALQMTPFIPQNKWMSGVAPPPFFFKGKRKNSFGERT